jgi:hypothetical protein
MACSWGAGNTDFKFYQGSSGSNAWTRDLLWKRSISAEAERLGFKKSKAAREQASAAAAAAAATATAAAGTTTASTSTGTAQHYRLVDSADQKQDFSVALPSARSARMGSHVGKLRERLEKQELKQRAILARAEEMLAERKRFGGRMKPKEANSWDAFLDTVKAPLSQINETTGEVDPLKRSLTRFPYDHMRGSRSGSALLRRKSSLTAQNRNRIAASRTLVAARNREKANQIARQQERKRLLLGGREPPFLTDSANRSQLGGRPASVSSGLYGTPIDKLVPVYGSVTELPTYDMEAPDWAGESELTVGEVLAPRENPAESDVDPFLTEYNAVFLETQGKDAAVLAAETSSGRVGDGTDSEGGAGDGAEATAADEAVGGDALSLAARPEQDGFAAQIESARRSLNSKVARQMNGSLASHR